MGEGTTPRLPAGVWKDPVCVLALGFGAGAMPYAPGTVGTLLAVPAYYFVAGLSTMAYALMLGLLFALGVWICQRAERRLGTHDHPSVVWDEVVGFLVTMFAAPAGWPWVVTGFLLFRLFDVWKPYPIRRLETRVRGGFGTMLDDVLAGLYAWACLQALAYVLGR